MYQITICKNRFCHKAQCAIHTVRPEPKITVLLLGVKIKIKHIFAKCISNGYASFVIYVCTNVVCVKISDLYSWIQNAKISNESFRMYNGGKQGWQCCRVVVIYISFFILRYKSFRKTKCRISDKKASKKRTCNISRIS